MLERQEEPYMSDIPQNIQRFNLIALVLFNNLYESFPSGIDIDALKVGHNAVPKDESYDDQAWDFGAVAYDVVLWLAEEGFLRYENPNHTREFFNARLTMKGLTVLGYVPTSLQPSGPKEPLINRVRRVLAGGAEKAAAEGVSTILGQVFSLALANCMGGTLANV
jgi:hypothetical protein